MTTSLQGKSAFLETHNFLDETRLICGIRRSFTATASGIRLPTDKTIVQATLDPAELNKDQAIDHALLGDAGLTLTTLLAAVEDRLGTTRRGQATQLVSRIQASKRRWLEQWMPGLTSHAVPLSACVRTASSGICCTRSMWPGPSVSTTPGRETVVGAQHPGGLEGRTGRARARVGDCGRSQDLVTGPMLTRLYCQKDVDAY